MRLRMGSQVFENVSVPLLWGTRAVLQDKKSRLSVVDLGGATPRLEILGGSPAPGVEYRPVSDGGFEVLRGTSPLYQFDPGRGTLRAVTLRLPECEIGSNQIRVGTNTFQNNMISGFGVGIRVDTDGGIAMGAQLPPGLAELRI